MFPVFLNTDLLSAHVIKPSKIINNFLLVFLDFLGKQS